MQQLTTTGSIQQVEDRTPAQEARRQAMVEAREAQRAQAAQIQEAVKLGLKVRRTNKPMTEAPLFGQVHAKQERLF